jgi:hypothetical protein
MSVRAANRAPNNATFSSDGDPACTAPGGASKNPACAGPGGAASRRVSSSNRSRRAFSARVSALALVMVVISWSGYVQALGGLTGDLSYDVEILIEVQDREPGELGGRGDDQVGY